MLDTAVLKQLNDPDPDTRRKAILALARMQDESALGYLATVYKKDRDPEIRQLAKKAGLYIKKHTEELFPASAQSAASLGALAANNNNDLMSSASTYYEELDLPEAAPVIQVSELNQERAKGLLEQAMDANLRGNNDRALHYFRNALKRNPNLKTDSYTLSMASTVTGFSSGEQAMELLQEKQKRGRGSSPVEDDATWSNAFIDLLIYGLINAAVVGVTLYLFFALVLPPLSDRLMQEAAAQSSSLGQANPLAALSGLSASEILFNLMNTFSIPFTLATSAIYGLFTILYILIFYLFIHMVSMGILSGEGSFRRLITKATLPQAFLTPILTLVSVGVFFLPVVNPELAGLSTIVLFGSVLLYYIVLSVRIGVTYRFSGFTGCGATILATIGISLASCTLSFMWTSIATNGITIR